jgi:hypothetical protein
MTVIEIKPHRWGWKVLEAPHHEADSFVIQIQALVGALANGLEPINWGCVCCVERLNG